MRTEDNMSMIEPVIDHSLSLLPGRAGAGDIAHGILAAMRRVRAALEEIGGYTLVSLLDEAMRDRLIIRRLRMHRAGGSVSYARLPKASANAGTAETVMVAAVDACLIYAADLPDSSAALSVLLLLVDRLIETLGEAPHHGDLAVWLAIELDDDEPQEHPEAAFAISVH